MTVIALPRILDIGGGAAGRVGAFLQSAGLSRPMIVSDPFLRDCGLVDKLVAYLSANGIDAGTPFCDTVSDPTVASVQNGIAALRRASHDCVIGFGGGSPIDTAKAIAVFADLPGDIRDYRAPHLQDAGGLPIIAIPTTAGTGSEATRFTILSDEDTNEKMLCAGRAFLPLAGFVDYTLTLTMPPRLTADTGIDALTHAIEAYVSRKASLFSDGMALQAMRAIAPNLRTVFTDPGNAAAREAVMVGSTQAGIAFSNASVALVHGMSRPVGAHFHVSHGLSNAMLLPMVTAWSAPAAVQRYAACARTMGVASESDADQVAVSKLVEELRAINADLRVPSPAEFGIDRDRWMDLAPLMAEQALASGSPGNNPLVPTIDDMVGLYEQAYR